MGSPLGPLLANVFMGSIEETLVDEGKMPSFYKRYVDDTLIIMLTQYQQLPFFKRSTTANHQ